VVDEEEGGGSEVEKDGPEEISRRQREQEVGRPHWPGVSFMKLILSVSFNQRYRKSKIDCLRFVMCQLLTPVFQGFFFSCGH
jgi:hypothetical protein